MYARYPVSILTRGESLSMAWERVAPYYWDEIVPHLRAGENQLIVAHGSTLRALIKYLDQINDEDINNVEVGNGVPIIYTLDEHLAVVDKEIMDD
jgi:2,3-bisphosphoglycerate-dependent phosphoglycerate mutase